MGVLHAVEYCRLQGDTDLIILPSRKDTDHASTREKRGVALHDIKTLKLILPIASILVVINNMRHASVGNRKCRHRTRPCWGRRGWLPLAMDPVLLTREKSGPSSSIAGPF